MGTLTSTIAARPIKIPPTAKPTNKYQDLFTRCTQNHNKNNNTLFLHQLLGYLSFLSLIWFMLAPLVLLIFIPLKFGFIHLFTYLGVCFCYNYIECKVHPNGLVGRKWPGFHELMGFLWAPFQRMMPVTITILNPDAFKPGKQFMFGFHPHGIIFLGATTYANTLSKLLPGMEVSHLMSSVCFAAPVFRQYVLWNGCIPATKEAATVAAKKHGHSLSLIPGGLTEMLESDPVPRSLEVHEKEKGYNMDIYDDGSAVKKTIVLKLQHRKGFIKLALQLGLDLVPVFTFGEIDTYRQSRWGMHLRQKISRLITVPVSLIWGKWIFLPFITPLNVVFGDPVPVEKDENPSIEKIEETHRKYMKALCDLYEKHKAEYNHANARLIVM